MAKKKTLSIVATGRRLHTSVGRCGSDPLDVPSGEAKGYIDAGVAELVEGETTDDQDDDSSGPDVTDTD